MKFQFIYPAGTWSAGRQNMSTGRPFIPPLGILYLSSCLERAGHKANVIDYWAEKFDKNKLAYMVRTADAVGITIASFNLRESIDICHFVKEIDPNVPLIVGGPHVTLYPQKSLIDTNADIAVQGEGEPGIVKLAEAITGKNTVEQVDGVYYRKNGEIKKGKNPCIVNNLDELPFPARHLVFDYDYGHFFGSKVTEGKATSISSSRGCPSKCRFCQRNFFSMDKFRMRTAENVLEEIKTIADDGYHTVIFVDDNFLADNKRAEKIVDGIIKENLDLEMWAEGRVTSADENLYKKMKKAGFKALSFGIEAGTQEVLDFYDKNITLPQIKNAISLSRKVGFYTHGSFILGAPIETKKHLEDTIKFAQTLPLDLASFFVLEYCAGSPLWEEAIKSGKIRSDEYHVYADKSRGLGNFKKEEIDFYAQYASKEFYIRGKYIADQIIIGFIRRDFRLMKALIKLLMQKDGTKSNVGI